MTRLVRSLASDERGGSIIEMALVMPVLASLLIGMVDISRAYSAKLQLEQAAHRSIEKVQQYQVSESTYATLQTEAATAAGVATSAVTIDYWLECNGTRQASSATVCSSGQTYTRYITVSIDKIYTPLFGSRFFPGANPDGTYMITAVAGMRTQ